MFKLISKEVQGWEIVMLHGDLDQSSIGDFKSEIERMLSSDKRMYVVDFSNLKFISSEGLNVLLWFRYQLSKKGEFRLVLSNASSFLEKIFNITKIDAHFEVVADSKAFLEREAQAESV